MRKSITHSPKSIFSNKRMVIKIYMIISIIVMAFTFSSQVIWIVKQMVEDYKHSCNILSFVFKIKVFIFIMLLLIIKK